MRWAQAAGLLGWFFTAVRATIFFRRASCTPGSDSQGEELGRTSLVPTTSMQVAVSDPFDAAMMSAVWAAFARTGRPDAKGYPAWPAYDAVSRRVFLFDDPARVAADPDADVRVFWRGQ